MSGWPIKRTLRGAAVGGPTCPENPGKSRFKTLYHCHFADSSGGTAEG